MSRQSGLHRYVASRQQRAARWMFLGVLLLVVAVFAAAGLVAARQGVSVFIHGG